MAAISKTNNIRNTFLKIFMFFCLFSITSWNFDLLHRVILLLQPIHGATHALKRFIYQTACPNDRDLVSAFVHAVNTRS